MSDNMKYEEALAQIETILRKMENNEYGLDELATQLKKAQQLVKCCRDKLTKVEKDISEIQAEQA